MLNIVANNPFRILGVYSNATPAEIASNCDDMEAYLNIGQSIQFDLDFNNILPPVNRTDLTVQQAKRQINLPKQKLKYALFWFFKDSSSAHAMNHLSNREFENANSVFEIEESFSTLINKAVVSTMQNDLGSAIAYLTEMVHNESLREEFVNAVCGNTVSIGEDELSQLYINALHEEIDAFELLELYEENAATETDVIFLREKAVGGYISRINTEIAKAKSVSQDDADANYLAGKSLMEKTKSDLEKISGLLGKTEVNYQMLADDLAKTILQCGINYYNNSDEDEYEEIDKAYMLQNYALSISVGKLTKDRCRKNVDILKEKKKQLPPLELREHDTAIKASIVEKLILNGQTIENAINLMKECAPHIVAIKEHPEFRAYYLNISTQVVNAALSSVIDEHNKVTDEINESEQTVQRKITSLRKMLTQAWQAFLMMDQFDTEQDFKEGRYLENRNAIREVIEKVGGYFKPTKQEIIDEATRKLGRPLTLWEIDEFTSRRRLELPEYSSRVIQSSFGRYGTHRLPTSTNTIPKTFGLYSEIEYDELDLRTEDELFHDCKRAKDFKYYSEKYPDGKHISEAIMSYENCLAEECGTIAECNSYLTEFPNGRHEQKVKEKLEDLVYRSCYKKREDYEKYLVEYPQGRYRLRAKDRIKEINEFYACTTIEDYRSYLNKYPQGLFLREAKDKVDDLVFASCSRKNDYRNYLQQYPNGRHKQEAEKQINEGCYIATMCYGDYDHPQVMVLRDFRDSVLLQYSLGRAFVRFYYRHSPQWVEYLQDKHLVNVAIRKVLDKFIILFKYVKK